MSKAKTSIKLGLASFILVASAIIAAFVGYVLNILALVQTESIWPLSGLVVGRLIGIFLPPIGSILGLFF